MPQQTAVVRVLSAYQDMILARNPTDAHARDFRSEWRVPTIHPESIRTSVLAHYALLEMLDVFNLCIVAQRTVAPTNSSPVIPPRASSPPPHRATHATTPRRSYRSMWAVFTRSNSVRGTLPWRHRVARCSGDVPGKSVQTRHRP